MGAAHPKVDFAAHAASLGAESVRVRGVAELEAALVAARRARTTRVIAIDTDPKRGTAEGGAWWDVPVSDAPKSARERLARRNYDRARRAQALGG